MRYDVDLADTGFEVGVKMFGKGGCILQSSKNEVYPGPAREKCLT